MTGIGIEYKGVSSISGPIIVVENVKNVGYDELVSVKVPNGEIRLGKVIQVSQKAVMVQVFEGTTDLSPSETRTRFLGHILRSTSFNRDAWARHEQLRRTHRRPPTLLHRRKTRRKRLPTQPNRTRVPQRLHTNRHIRHRRLSQPCPRTKTPSFQRSRLITQRACSPNRTPSTNSQCKRALQHRLHRYGSQA